MALLRGRERRRVPGPGAIAIDNAMRSEATARRPWGFSYMLVVILLQSVLMIPGMMLIAAFLASASSTPTKAVRLWRKEKMKSALEALKRTIDVEADVVAARTVWPR